jgi:cellulose synthase/poly-beta-1,6-N-acetylglucosamine synthase-like glycosyltransferase
MLLYICLLISGLYTGLLLYLNVGWNRIKPGKVFVEAPSTRVTVVVVARNEEERIQPLLESLVHQRYPKNLLECLVVDDHSDDGTALLVERYSDRGIRLMRLTDLPGNFPMISPKKQGITQAIQATSGSLIVTTDADCKMGPDWIASVVARYETERPDMLVMPVRMHGGRGVAAVFQALDFMMLQAITVAFHGLKKPVLCNGANLAYTREAFESVGGFAGNDHLASGDDLFLLHKITSMPTRKVVYHLSEDVVVNTLPESGWLAFFRQRIRWGSKTRHYRDGSLLPVLAFVFLYNLILMIWMVMCMQGCLQHADSCKAMRIVLGVGFGIKMIAELSLMMPAARFFNLRKTIIWFPLMQPLHVGYTVLAGILSQFRTFTWKGRRLH